MQSYEARISELESELYSARMAVIELLPKPVRKVAQERHNPSSSQEFREWKRRLVETAIELAHDGPTFPADRGRHRVPCPLCRSTGNHWHRTGFLFPNGLEQHLTGYGNAKECPPMAEIRKLASRTYRKLLQEEMERERHLEANKEAFLLGPNQPPQLPHAKYGTSRDEDSMQWAVDRILELGFAEERDGSVRAFVLKETRWVAYADPRQEGRIRFHVYPRGTEQDQEGETGLTPEHFDILDTWKHDLKDKFNKRIPNKFRR